MLLGRGWQIFPEKGHIVSSSGFADYVVSVAAAQFCKAAMDQKKVNTHSRVPIKLSLRKRCWAGVDPRATVCKPLL